MKFEEIYEMILEKNEDLKDTELSLNNTIKTGFSRWPKKNLPSTWSKRNKNNVGVKYGKKKRQKCQMDK